MELERLKGGIFIYPKDIALLNNCTVRNAQYEHRTIRDVLGITNGRLTVKAYCDYCNIDYNEVVRYINPYRNPK